MKFVKQETKTIEMFFFKNYAENEAGRLVLDLFLFLIKLNKVKAIGLQLSFNIFRYP